MATDINTLNITQLKALAYDVLAELEQRTVMLQNLNKLILEKSQGEKAGDGKSINLRKDSVT